MEIGWYERLISGFGRGLCHQIPERSFVSGGIYFPVCARDTGIYVGFVFVLVSILWYYRGRHPSGRVSVPFYVVVALGVVAMAWDGISSYAGLRVTTNLIRLVTGSMFGGSLALATYAMMADVVLANRQPSRLLGRARSVVVWWAAVMATVAVVYVGLPLLGAVAPALVTLAVVATFALVGTAAVGLTPRFRNSVGDLRSALRAGAAGTVIGVVTIVLSKVIQAGLDRLAEALVS